MTGYYLYSILKQLSACCQPLDQ